MKQGMKFLTTLTGTMNSWKNGSVAKLEGRASVVVEFLSRWLAVSAATSVSSRKASFARHSKSFGSNCFNDKLLYYQ